MLFRFCDLKSDSLVAVRKADIPEVKRLLHGMISFIRIAESRPELRERFEKFCADVSAGRLTEADPDSEACEGDYPFFNAYLALSGELLRLLKPDAEPGAEGEGGEYVSLKFSELTGEMKITGPAETPAADFEEIDIFIENSRRTLKKHYTVKDIKTSVKIEYCERRSWMAWPDSGLPGSGWKSHENRINFVGKKGLYLLISCLLARCNPAEWIKMNGPLYLDGVSVKVQIKLSNGETVSIDGNGDWPESFKTFLRCLDTLLRSEDVWVMRVLTSEEYYRSAVDFMVEYTDYCDC